MKTPRRRGSEGAIWCDVLVWGAAAHSGHERIAQESVSHHVLGARSTGWKEYSQW